MTETTLLISGFFCFGLTVLGMALTVIEFNKTRTPAQPVRRTSRKRASRYTASPATALS